MKITPIVLALLSGSLIVTGTGCKPSVSTSSSSSSSSSSSASSLSLTEARRGFKTAVEPQIGEREPVEKAPEALFRTVKYPASPGQFEAYLTPDPGDGKKHPAIVWITGGDCNSIGDVWSPSDRENDQSAAAFRKAGIVMLFPSLRGGNENPGTKEGFFGEVDDILAAVRYLEKQPYVDPQRIYLGGHSTGGTLALLVAESSDRFRAVFSFGPVDDVSGYGADSGFLPFNIANRKEVELRSPGYFLKSVRSPVWVIEGTEGNSNIDSLRKMAKTTTNPNVHFIEIAGSDHFATLAPTNDLLAAKIIADTATTSTLTLSEAEVNQNFTKSTPR
jgi:alpha/beta superfamily hydrolase